MQLPTPVSDDILDRLRAVEDAARQDVGRLSEMKHGGAGPSDIDAQLAAAKERVCAAARAVLDMQGM